MAGIYIHIPFCKQACHYCDFHFSTSLKNKSKIIEALQIELQMRKSYLVEDVVIETIYIGGGTPSLLDISDLQALFATIYKNFSVSKNPEITLEANPDDLTINMLHALRSTPVNRLSIGIQSFFDEDLQWMNRAHSAKEAKIVLKNAVNAGFTNLTADLIFGFPLLSDEKWAANLNMMTDSGINHISAYGMTVEKGTPLAKFIQKGKQKPIEEEQSARQFSFLMDFFMKKNWEQYEISNFAQEGCYSKHNANYWRGVTYLGIGPSAHSYNGHSRQWNTKINNRYIAGVLNGETFFEKETLSPKSQLNEYIMTALRTMWGISREVLKREFGTEADRGVLNRGLPFQAQNQLHIDNNKIRLTQSGKLLADYIASALFC